MKTSATFKRKITIKMATTPIQINTASIFKEYKNAVNKFNENEIYLFGDDYTACFTFTYYFHKHYGLPLADGEPKYNYVLDITKLDDLLQTDGIYSIDTYNNTEIHYFILVVQDNKVTLLSTYGGQKSFINKSYNKQDFIHKMKDLYLHEKNNKKQIALYRELFGIKTSLTNLDLSKYSFQYTYANGYII